MTAALPRVCASPAEALAHGVTVGGKAENLARLEGWGQPVPPWYVLTTRAFDEALEGLGGRQQVLGRLAAAAAAGDEELTREGERARRELEDGELPAALAAEIAAAHAARVPAGSPVAVRSSAVGEDAAAASFAGLHDSVLFVSGTEALAAAVRRVWASAFGERALAYRRAQGIPLTDIALAVVVQEMIPARSSGVAFTANPLDGDVHEVVISALWGAGEGLVSAGLDADTWTVDKETGETRQELAVKEQEMAPDPGASAGLVRRPVAAARRQTPSLTADEVAAVARAALAIECRYGRPQDIEFAVAEDGALAILQARPVTTVAELGPAAGNRLLWDNSNIIESYSGVTSPMTFSFIRRAYAIVYHCFAEVMGIPRRRVTAHREVFENMLGLFRGQVYYNLHNWYRLVRLFPGYAYNRRFMESMMGVREPGRPDAEDPPAEPGWFRRTAVELPALIRLGLRSGWRFLRIRRVVGAFQDHFREHHDRWAAMDFDALPPHRLMRLYREMEDKLLWQWKAPIINDFYVMVAYGLLRHLCAAWCRDASGSLQNDLLAGEGGIESTEPTKQLLALAGLAARDPELRRAILAEPPATLAAAVAADPRFASFAAAVGRYLDRYGFRCMNELKLEEPSLRDRPDFLYQVLRNYLAAERPPDPEEMERREREVRRRAEERAFAALRRSPLRRLAFRRVLAAARLGVKNRENLRFARTRIYGVLRELLLAAGRRLAEADLLGSPEDVFYLTLDELWDYVKGTAVTVDLAGLVELRRREFDGYRSDGPETAPADRFETFGMAYHRNRFRGRPPKAGEGGAAGDGVLRGVGCCPGEVEGPVKVIASPGDDARLDGEILVAGRTDPGWVPLYPSASGLLIERGSILSHSAIVAREMGLPAIVGIPGLLAALATGQRVRMDGAAGTVEVLGAAAEGEAPAGS